MSFDLGAVPARPAQPPAQLLPQLQWLQIGTPGPVTGVTARAERVVPGGLFAACKGERADGHDFVAAALARGAGTLLLERAVQLPADAQVWVAVADDVRAALAQAVQRFFGDPGAALLGVGITGTNGKTTCASLLQEILTAAGHLTCRIGTLGSAMGAVHLPPTLTTPAAEDLLAQLAQAHLHGATAVVLEASSQALAQRRLDGVPLRAALFLNLSPEHLDWHGDMANYGAAKARLLQRLGPGGVAVFNLDDPWSAQLHAAAGPTAWGFSAHAYTPGARVFVLQVDPVTDGMRLQLRVPQGTLTLHSPLFGAFNVENLVACVSVGLALGLPLGAISAGVAKVAAVPGRLEQISGPKEPCVVVDFAHTPAAVAAALLAMRSRLRAPGGRLFCVLGCGGERDASKRAPMGAAASECADYVVLTSDNPRGELPLTIAAAMAQGIERSGGLSSRSYVARGYAVELDRAAAIAHALQLCSVDDALLIAGKGHEREQRIGSNVLPFCDREVARRLLQTWSAAADKKQA